MGSTKENFNEKEWYREKIIDMVKHIDDIWVLSRLFRLIKCITKEG